MSRIEELLRVVRARKRAAVMAIINTTPDSFYDGGRYASSRALSERVSQVLRQGAELLDVGGESSKPGAAAVAAAEQIERIRPALLAARELNALISVDTAHPEVADFALAQGACVINDVTCLSSLELARVVANHGGHLILSHARAHQSRMTGFSQWPDDSYQDVAKEVLSELNAAADRAQRVGLKRSQLIFDPGLGFSKNAEHCFRLMRDLGRLLESDVPWLVGPGRKSFLAAVDASPPEQRLGGTIAASLFASRAGAPLLRVHDVFEVCQALRVAAALERGSSHEVPR